MWTLITPSKHLTVGIFPDKVSAEEWNVAHCLPQGLTLEPIELMLQTEHEVVLRENQLMTSSAEDVSGLPVC